VKKSTTSRAGIPGRIPGGAERSASRSGEIRWSSVPFQELRPDRRRQPVVELPHASETDFDLRGVDVDVDLVRRKREEDERHRIPAVRDELAVRLVERPQQDAIADVPAVQEEMEPFGVDARVLRGGDVGVEVGGFDLLERPRDLFAVKHGDAAPPVGRRERVAPFAVDEEVEPDAGQRDGEPRHRLDDVLRLDLDRTEKLPTHRNVLEQVADFDDGPGRRGRRFDGRGGAVFDDEFGAFPPRRPAEQADPRDRADGRERFPAKAEGGDPEQVVGAGELAGGVRGEREEEFVGGDAVAVVGDPEQLAAALLDVDPDFAAARVESVFDELFDGARRPLDHLAGRDLVHDVRGQHLDLRHRRQP
jgi:hypothetical protein